MFSERWKLWILSNMLQPATSAKPNKFRTLGVFVFDLRYSWDGFWLILSSRICLRKSCFLLNSWILVCLTYMKKYPRNSLEVGKTARRACRNCITLFIEVYGFGLSLNIDLQNVVSDLFFDWVPLYNGGIYTISSSYRHHHQPVEVLYWT